MSDSKPPVTQEDELERLVELLAALLRADKLAGNRSEPRAEAAPYEPSSAPVSEGVPRQQNADREVITRDPTRSPDASVPALSLSHRPDDTVPPPALQQLLAIVTRVERVLWQQLRRAPRLLVGGSVVLGVVGLALWGAGRHVGDRVEGAIARTPSLGSYDLRARVWGTTAYLQGTLPTDRLRDRARDAAREALPGFLKLEDATTVARRDPEEITAEVRRLLAAANLSDGVDLAGQYADGTVTLRGRVMRLQDREEVLQTIATALETVPGVMAVENVARAEPAHIATRLYFAPDSSRVPPRDIGSKLLPLESLLAKNPSLQVRIVGYRHTSERATLPGNRSLALGRALEVQYILADRGIDRRRLLAVGREGAPPDLVPGQDPWLNRCVLFEIVRDP